MEEIFGALADPVRLALIDRMYREDGLTLGQLCRSFSVSRQAISKHLICLVDAGLVRIKRQGRERLHYLKPDPIHRLFASWLTEHDALPDGEAGQLRAKRWRRFYGRVRSKHF